MPDKHKHVAAVVMAAGKGVRMKSDFPKVVHEINGKALICYVADTLKELGVDKAVIVVGYKKEIVRQTLRDYDVEFAVQEEQLGTGHAVMMAEENLRDFEGDILVLSGDVPLLRPDTLNNLLQEHYKRQAVATVLTSLPPDPGGYGRVKRNLQGLVEKIVEHKDATEEERQIGEINTGTFVFKKNELYSALKKIDNNNTQGEYYLTDLMEIFLAQDKPTAAYQAEDYREGLGINSKEQLLELIKAYNL